jgi:hypothetical protein
MKHISSLFSLMYWTCKIILILVAIKFYIAPVFAVEKILFIGDSHSVSDFHAPFGKRIEAKLETLPNTTVDFYASCGSIVKSWYTAWKTNCGYVAHPSVGEKIVEKSYAAANVDELINKIKPSLVIVELSGNYVNVGESFDVTADTRRLAKKIHESGARCLWVTMPDSRKYPDRPNVIVPKIKLGVSDYCDIFESHHVVKYPKHASANRDGVHYSFGSSLYPNNPDYSGIAAANNWADLVFNKILEMTER